VTLPTFIVIGAGRSGTTSLHQLLGQHPGIFMCRRKSPNHFAATVAQPEWETPVARGMAKQWVSDRAEYEELFAGAPSEAVVGEVSPVYLQAVDVARRIHETVPDVRLIAILRDPVERAYSHFVGRRRDGIEPEPSFARRIQRELDAPLPDDVAFGHYLGCGRYHHFLTPYFDRFRRDQLRVHLYDDLLNDPDALLADVFAFLGVDPGFAVDTSARLNRTGEIRNPFLRRAWTTSVRARTAMRPYLPAAVRRAGGQLFLDDLEKSPLDADLHRRMLDVLDDDIGRLEQQIDRDLSAWRRAKPTTDDA
jgi:hypothetical protein